MTALARLSRHATPLERLAQFGTLVENSGEHRGIAKKVSRETLRAFRRKQPDAPVCDCNVGEYFRRVLVELALHSLAGIVGDGGDVNQSLYAVIDSRGGDDGATLRVPDENRGA